MQPKFKADFLDAVTLGLVIYDRSTVSFLLSALYCTAQACPLEQLLIFSNVWFFIINAM